MYDLQALEAFAARFYQGYDLLITPYGYTASFLALAAATTQTAAVNIAANADFIMTAVRYHATTTGAEVGQSVSSKAVAMVRMLITDTGSAEQFTAQAVDLENYCTNDSKSQDLPYPRIVAGRTSLSVSLTNYSAGATEAYPQIDLFFNGVLVRAYDRQGGQQGPRGSLSIA